MSSDADSDFIEVPAGGSQQNYNFLLHSELPLPAPMELNKPPSPDTSKNFRLQDLKSKMKHSSIEIILKTDELANTDDDIFADIFAAPDSNRIKTSIIEAESLPHENVGQDINIKEVHKEEETLKEDVNKPDIAKEKLIKNTNENSNEVIEIFDSDSNDHIAAKENELKIEVNSKPNPVLVSDILNDLNKEISTITNLNLDSLLPEKKEEGSESLLKVESNTEVKIDDILESMTTKAIDIDEAIKHDGEVEKANLPVETVDITAASPKDRLEEATSKESSADLQVEPVSSAVEQEAEPKSIITTEPVASTSYAVEIIDEKQTIENAASILREDKTTEELETMAKELNQDRIDLYSEMRKNERMASTITERMTLECMDLLKLFGVPFIVAPMEAEAQCAFLDFINLTDGTITDDSDIWLFGGQTVYKNFFDQNKLVVEYKLSNIKNLFHLDRKEMVQLSFLVGSDYTTGIHGIGSVTALEILSVFGSNQDKANEGAIVKSTLSTLRKFRDWLQNNSPNTKTGALRKKLKNITIGQDFPNERVSFIFFYGPFKYCSLLQNKTLYCRWPRLTCFRK